MPRLGALICLAEKTKGVSIEYFIIGEGVMKPVLEEKVRELELDNVHILPYQQKLVCRPFLPIQTSSLFS